MDKVLITAFGFRARSGKDACVEHLMDMHKGLNILHTSFAKGLRSEVHKRMYQVMREQGMTAHRDALEFMCIEAGVPFDPRAVRDKNDPHGKQRHLLQQWGIMRRAECADYWLKKVEEEIETKQPSLVLISDLRFENEAEWVKSHGGKTVKVDRIAQPGLTGEASKHASECSLVDYNFDYTIVNDGTLKQLHKKAREVYTDILKLRLF